MGNKLKKRQTSLERRRKAYGETMAHISGSKWSRGYTQPGSLKK